MHRQYIVDTPEYGSDPAIKVWDPDLVKFRDITPDERLDALENLVLQLHVKLHRLGQ